MPKQRKKREYKRVHIEGKSRKPKTIVIMEKEADEMFRLWCRVRDAGGCSEVARAFGRSLSTVQRNKKKRDWAKRHDAIRKRVHQNQDTSIVNDEISNLHLVRVITNAAAKRIKTRLKEDDKYTPTIHEFVALVRLEEELSGNLLPSGVDGQPLSSKIHILLPDNGRPDKPPIIEQDNKFIDRETKK